MNYLPFEFLFKSKYFPFARILSSSFTQKWWDFFSIIYGSSIVLDVADGKRISDPNTQENNSSRRAGFFDYLTGFLCFAVDILWSWCYEALLFGEESTTSHEESQGTSTTVYVIGLVLLSPIHLFLNAIRSVTSIGISVVATPLIFIVHLITDSIAASRKTAVLHAMGVSVVRPDHVQNVSTLTILKAALRAQREELQAERVEEQEGSQEAQRTEQQDELQETRITKETIEEKISLARYLDSSNLALEHLSISKAYDDELRYYAGFNAVNGDASRPLHFFSVRAQSQQEKASLAALVQLDVGGIACHLEQQGEQEILEYCRDYAF